MRRNTIWTVIFNIAKILALVVLVVLGLVLVPDDMVGRIGRGIGEVRDRTVREYSQRAPQITQEVSQRVIEIKSDAQDLYRLLTEKYYPSIRDWLTGKFIY